MFVLPSLIELTPDKAKKQLRNSEHVGQTTINYNGKCSFSNGQGNIYQQDPSAGTQVDQSVNLTVHTGCFSMRVIMAIPNWGGTTTPPGWRQRCQGIRQHDIFCFSRGRKFGTRGNRR